MSFFGMGPMEITVILVVALIIFGPGKLPEVAGQVGKAIRDFRRMTTDLQEDFEKTTGVKDIRRQVEQELTGVKSQVSGAAAGVKKDMSAAAKNVNTTVSSAAKKATSSTSSTTASSAKASAAKSATTKPKSTTASKKDAPPVATKADPLADVSFLDDVVAAPSNGTRVAPSANGHAPRASAPDTVSTNPASDSASGGATSQDAVTRARQRRQQAGYNRSRA
jgi:TatA/E family protein of Tat protein translocase